MANKSASKHSKQASKQASQPASTASKHSKHVMMCKDSPAEGSTAEDSTVHSQPDLNHDFLVSVGVFRGAPYYVALELHQQFS